MEQQFFTFVVITPTHSETLSIEWVEIESPTGSFFVGPDHCSLVSIIKNKTTILYKKTNAEECSLDVPNGIFKVHNNKAIALLDV